MKEFESIYLAYFDSVFRYLKGLTVNENLAEELTAETFFKAMNSIEHFHGDCEIRVWLCQIAKNTYFSHYKRQKRQIALKDEADTVTQNSLEQQLIDKDQAFQLHQKLHELREPYKEVFSLRVFGELSFRQIGELFERNEHWACITFHRAKAMIQESRRR